MSEQNQEINPTVPAADFNGQPVNPNSMTDDALAKAAADPTLSGALSKRETWLANAPNRKAWDKFLDEVERVAGTKNRAADFISLAYHARELMVQECQAQGDGFKRGEFVKKADNLLEYTTSAKRKYVDCGKLLKIVGVCEVARSTFADPEQKHRVFPSGQPPKDWIKGNIAYSTLQALCTLIDVQKGAAVDTYTPIDLPGSEKFLRDSIDRLQSCTWPCNETFVRSQVASEIQSMKKRKLEAELADKSPEDRGAFLENEAAKERDKKEAAIKKKADSLLEDAIAAGMTISDLRRLLEKRRVIPQPELSSAQYAVVLSSREHRIHAVPAVAKTIDQADVKEMISAMATFSKKDASRIGVLKSLYTHALETYKVLKAEYDSTHANCKPSLMQE
jgi:hypothetical protein